MRQQPTRLLDGELSNNMVDLKKTTASDSTQQDKALPERPRERSGGGEGVNCR